MSEIDLKNLNVVFAGCARDCEKYIPKVFENLKSYSSLFKDSYKIIVENGSKDKTREILKNLKNNKDYFYFKDEFNDFNFRGKRLEFARNLIIEKIKDTEQDISKLNNNDKFNYILSHKLQVLNEIKQ